MSGAVIVLLMSGFLGATSFAAGMLPLSISFSKNHLEMLSFLGTGLLVGTALGVIIPEGVETIVATNPNEGVPSSQIALCLLVGFSFMLIVEQFLSPHTHSHSSPSITLARLPQGEDGTGNTYFFSELTELEQEQGTGGVGLNSSTSNSRQELEPRSAYPLTLGLFVHGLADGLALGASAVTPGGSDEHSSLSLIVFLALLIHKAPTALALSTSLLSTSLTRMECRQHLAFFSVSTPVGAILSYVVFTFLGSQEGDWAGMALLISGGTFLYVATVLQPVSHSQSTTEDKIKESTRALLIIAGMFIPFFLGSLSGHGHDHARDRGQ